MIALLESFLPQLVALIVFSFGLMGRSMVAGSAEKIATYFEKGGANKQAIKEACTAIASSVLIINAYFSTLLILLLLCISGPAIGRNDVISLLFGAIALLTLGMVGTLLAKHSLHEFSILKQNLIVAHPTISQLVKCINLILLVMIIILPLVPQGFFS